jgi:hypothetical protein
MNYIELETPNGPTNCAIDLLSKTKLTVCGSPTTNGLYQLTLSPTLICTFCGENVVNGADVPPHPACTLVTLPVVLKQRHWHLFCFKNLPPPQALLLLQ